MTLGVGTYKGSTFTDDVCVGAWGTRPFGETGGLIPLVFAFTKSADHAACYPDAV